MMAKTCDILMIRKSVSVKGDISMAFFNDLKDKAQTYAGVAAEKAKDVAGAAAEKAKDLKDTAKLNLAISGEQRELDKNYRAIGEWFVAECPDDIPDAIKDVVAACRVCKERIIELESQKEQLKND